MYIYYFDPVRCPKCNQKIELYTQQADPNFTVEVIYPSNREVPPCKIECPKCGAPFSTQVTGTPQRFPPNMPKHGIVENAVEIPFASRS